MTCQCKRVAGMVVRDAVADYTGSLSGFGLDGNLEEFLGHVGISNALAMIIIPFFQAF